MNFGMLGAAIVMGIAAVAITNVLDSTRKNAFVASGKQFVEGAKDGFKVSVFIIPYLVAIMVGVSMFKACGALDLIKNFFGGRQNCFFSVNFKSFFVGIT